MATQSDMIGKTIDKYEITSLIGEGNMGAVYKAKHGTTGREVALKIITDEAVKNADLVSRFERESKAAAKIATPYIVEILGAGRDPKTELPFLVTTLLVGENVRSLVERLGPLPPGLAVRIVGQVCLGLQKAHTAGVVHRDIKPANIFLSGKQGEERLTKLLDFGVAKLKMEHASATDNESLTRTGNVLGTPMYMSPEQARGKKGIDHRADIWSLGVVLYELLCGEPPYKKVKGLGDLILAICDDEAPSVLKAAPWVPPELAQIVEQALRLDKKDRYQTAAAMCKALEKVIPPKWVIDDDLLAPLTAADKQAYQPEPATRQMDADEVASLPLVEPAAAAGAEQTSGEGGDDEDAGAPSKRRPPPPPRAGAPRPGDRGSEPKRKPPPPQGAAGSAQSAAVAEASPEAGDEPDALDEADGEVAALSVEPKPDSTPSVADAPASEPTAESAAPTSASPVRDGVGSELELESDDEGGLFGSTGARIAVGIGVGVAIGVLAIVVTNVLSPAESTPSVTATAAASQAAGETATGETATGEPADTAEPDDADAAVDAAADEPDAATEGDKTVKVKIIPAFAGVAVNGERQPPKDGYIELSGEIGSTHDIVVTVGGRPKAVRVRITEQGAAPNQIIHVVRSGGKQPAYDLYE